MTNNIVLYLEGGHLNIYEMYVEHWKERGFWVRRTTWGNTIAKIKSVGELSGRAPYYGNPEVVATIYDIHTGEIKEDDFIITTAGTYKTWRWVQPPKWSSEKSFDPSAGRILLHIPFGENSRASSMGARWSDLLDSWWIPEGNEKLFKKSTERGYLNQPEKRVHFKVGFENKNLAKEMGGYFHPNTKTWSFGVSDVEAINRIKELGFEPCEVDN
jgi:hypothetical protein